ncbi:hypothetical protein [Coleofasciculus chthonoplastes]|uniref:hypothetical protein n=1 Tax=Coleofasciculus chthonoplastes TaxID=64178 RepID=UPI0012FB6B3F|nr:hypothetical protein [Coleofasciculus chthonoplastes]
MTGKPITFIQNPLCVTNNIRLMDAIAWNIRIGFVVWWWGRAGFVVLFAVCVMIEFLNPPLHDGVDDWCAIA